MLLTPAQLTRRSFFGRAGHFLGGMFIAAPAFAASPAMAADKSLGKRVEEFYDAYEALDVGKLIALLTDDCFFEDPTFHLIARGKPEILKMAESLPRHYADVKFSIEHEIGCRNWFVTQQRITGSFRASPDGGGEAKRIDVRGATILGFVRGKINRWTDYYDYATYLKQTGLKSNS